MKRFLKHIDIATHLGEVRFKHWLDRNAYEALAEIGVRPGQTLLDFGCGSGTYTIPAGKIVGKNGTVYALDLDKGALEMVEKRARDEGLRNIIRIDSSGGEVVPLGDGTIDVVLLIDVLQEIRDNGALLREIHRVVKPSGIVCIFPMHIGEEKIIGLAKDIGFVLKGRKVKGRLLIFTR